VSSTVPVVEPRILVTMPLCPREPSTSNSEFAAAEVSLDAGAPDNTSQLTSTSG
jgi:hypothetical protein